MNHYSLKNSGNFGDVLQHKTNCKRRAGPPRGPLRSYSIALVHVSLSYMYKLTANHVHRVHNKSKPNVFFAITLKIVHKFRSD